MVLWLKPEGVYQTCVKAYVSRAIIEISLRFHVDYIYKANSNEKQCDCMHVCIFYFITNYTDKKPVTFIYTYFLIAIINLYLRFDGTSKRLFQLEQNWYKEIQHRVFHSLLIIVFINCALARVQRLILQQTVFESQLI